MSARLLPLLLAAIVAHQGAHKAAVAAAACAPAVVSGQGEEEKEAPDERIEFEIPLEEGGSVAGKADSLEFDGEVLVVLSGNVEVVYQDLELRADRIELNRETEIVKAEGAVILDQGPRRLAGESLVFDLEAKTGTLTNASGYVSSDYFFTGDEVAKTGEDTYTVQRGTFTSCEQETPDWSFGVGEARVRVEGYAKTRGATLRAKGTPIFYIPYLVWPVKAERSSGLLIPKPGYSKRRGASLGLAYYQVLGPSYDTTFNLDLFSNSGYLGFGNEFRYHPTQGTMGNFQGYAVRDPERDDEIRWIAIFDHQSNDLPAGLRAVVSFEDVSDFDFFQDFERTVERNTQRQVYSNGYLTGNWGVHSFNLLLDSRETRVGAASVVTLRQLPEVEYKLRATRLGRSPFYFQMRNALHYFDAFRSERYDEMYGRAFLFPELTLPVRAWPWLSLSVTAGGNLTWYGNSLFAPEERPGQSSDFSGESLTRFLPSANVEMVGPSFSRILDAKGKRASKVKHVIEPRWTYTFIENFEEQDEVPLFDEIDRIRGSNIGRFSLVNRLMAKPADEKGGGAREILSLELSQTYSFDDRQPLQRSSDGTRTRAEGPVRALLRYNPSAQTTMRIDAAYNTLFSRIESTALSGSHSFGRHHLGVRWLTRTRPDDGETRTNQLRLAAGLGIVPRKLRVHAEVNYDINKEAALLQRYLADYNASCYSLHLEYGDYRTGGRRDREFRFSVTLRNVGTFLDITGGESKKL